MEVLTTFSAFKLLSIQDVKLGGLHRVVQIAALVVVIFLSAQEKPWSFVGGGQHYFSVTPFLSEADPFSAEGAPWTLDELVNVRRSSNSFFVPLGFREELETVGSCTGGWCPVEAAAPKTVQILSKTQNLQLHVSARFKPFKDTAARSDAVGAMKEEKKSGVFTNDEGFRTNVRDLVTTLASDEGISVDSFVDLTAEKGVEALVVYHWKCIDSSSLLEDGCDVTTELRSLGAANTMASPLPVVVTPPVDSTRRRYTFFGVVVHLRGEGGIRGDAWVPVLNMLTQCVAFLIVGTGLVSFIAFRCLPGAARRRAKASDIYVEQFHSKIANIVEIKKAAFPALAGLSNSLLHEKLADEIEALCGFALDGRHPDKVLKVLDAVLKASGSIHDASKELGPEFGAENSSRKRLKLLKAGNTPSMKQVVPGDNESTVSQETV
jgi:hypothetical protein